MQVVLGSELDLVGRLLAPFDAQDRHIVTPQFRLERRPAALPDLSAVFRRKRALVAWFVSNCYTQSRRELYVEQLRQFISVDVYGHCGTLQCPNSRLPTREACDAMVAEKYLFYLAFENSLCEDYFTEKLQRALSGWLVPVVLGGADYDGILLDVDNGPSPFTLPRPRSGFTASE